MLVALPPIDVMSGSCIITLPWGRMERLAPAAKITADMLAAVPMQTVFTGQLTPCMTS